MDQHLDQSHQSNFVLAPRWKRLIAAIIDSIIIFAVTALIIYLTSYVENGERVVPSTFWYNIFIAVVGISTYAVVNGSFLIKHGQTIGKKLLKIFIVDQISGEVPSKSNLIIRSIIYLIFPYSPLMGRLISLINVIAIFGKDRQCMHDFFAKTKVIEKNG